MSTSVPNSTIIVPQPTLLLFIPTLHGGGAEKVFTVLAEHFDRKRLVPVVAVLDEHDPRNVFRTHLPADVRVVSLGHRHVRYALPTLVRFVRSLNPAVVLSTLNYMNLATLICRRWFPAKTRVFVREANMPSLQLAHTRTAPLYRWLYRRYYPRADGIICQSEAVKTDLANLVGGDSSRRMSVIPNPIDTEAIRARARSSPDPYRRKGSPQFVAAGKLMWQKGFDLLLLAFAKLTAEYEGARLTILGEGSERERLVELAGRLDISQRVQFAGFVEHPEPYYRHADLFVLSSRWEGMPNAAAEALACGTPVVAFRYAGNAAEMIDDGRTGVLVSGDSANDLAVAIQRACKGLPRRNGDSLLPDRFAAQHVTRLYEELLLDGMRCVSRT